MNQVFVLLAVAAANSGIAMRVVEPMLPRLASEFDASVPAMASVITAFAFAQAGGQYFHGPFGDRFGKLRVATVLLGLSAIVSFGCALAQTLDALIFWRFATGLFSSGSMTLGMAYLADAVPAQHRQPILARFVSGTIIGQALGPLFGGVLTDLFGWRATFIVLGAVFAAVAAVLSARTRDQWDLGPRSQGPLLSPAQHLAVLKRPRARKVLIAVFLEMVFFYGAFSFLGAMLKARFDLAFTLIGTLLAGVGVGGLIYISIVHWILARLGQRGCAMMGGLLGGVFYLSVVFAPAWPLVMLCTIGLGFSFYMTHNQLQMKATEMAPQARGTGMSLFSMFWAGGHATGAALMGAGVAMFGYPWLIAAFGLFFAAFGITLSLRLDRM